MGRALPTKCLILAAGTGQRMKSFKPLVEVGGLPLIERVIATAHQAGLADFYVVTGNQAERLEAFLLGLSRRRGLRITTIRNPNWQTDNGSSLLESREHLAEDEFILIMGDHVVETGLIEKAMEKPLEGYDVALAVDSGVHENRLVDLDDVTKVTVDDGRVRAIGKGLVSYDAFDTGVFRCTPAVFAAAERSIESGDATLSGAIRLLAAKGGVKAIDVRGSSWVDVDTPVDVRKAESVLFGDLGKPQDGFVSATFNRPISSRFLTPLLLRLRSSITPNQVSLLGFAVSLLACLSFFLRLPFVGGALIHLASLLDGSDGEVARLKKLQSKFGGFFDAVLDRYGDGFAIFGMLYYAWTSSATADLLGGLAEPAVFVAGILALSGNFMVSYTSSKSVTDLGYQYDGGWLAAGRGRDLRLFVLSLGGLGALIHPASVLLALAIVAALVTAIVVRRTWVSWEYARGHSPFAGRKLKAVILDLDGTVADTMTFLSELAVGLISHYYDLPRTEARRGYLETTGLDFASQVERLFPRHPLNDSVAATMEEQKRSGLLDHPLFPDVIPALEFFRERDIMVFICSSTQEDLVRQFVAQAGIEQLIDGCYGYAPGLSKLGQLRSILHQYELDPRGVLFVGDSFVDHDFATAAGVRFIGLERLFKASEFRSSGLFSVRDLTALTDLYQRWDRLISFPEGPAAEPRALVRLESRLPATRKGRRAR